MHFNVFSKRNDEESSMDLDFSLHLGSEKTSSSRKSASISPQSIMKAPQAMAGAFHTDEGSTAIHWKTSNIFHPLRTPQETGSSYLLNQAATQIKQATVSPDLSSSIITNSKSSVTCTSGLTNSSNNNSSVAVLNSVVQRAWKDAPTFALHMGVDAVAVKKDAAVLPEGSLDYAFGMVGARDASKRAAPKVQKDSLAFAFHMEVAGTVSTPNVLKERKEVPCFARHRVMVSVVPLKGAIRGHRGAQLSVRVMVVGRDVHSKEMGSTRRVFMGAHSSVWPMVVARRVMCQVYQESKGKN
ncbi:hypothetical protein H5410_053939 [Solanum commersonii]|uniref:Uncharacterized protein n=1 Tax=Solanum commersonii TaxID=4109 RepID=A0A9J5X8P7_SOLCO|nr:hypothetical protein H5410_053939 [Solanum commersonii]